MSNRKYIPIGIDLLKTEDVDVKALVFNDTKVNKVLTQYKNKEITLPQVYIKQSTYSGLINYLIEHCIPKFKNKFDIYTNLFQLMEMCIADASVAYIYNQTYDNKELLSLLSKSDSFDFGFKIFNKFLEKLYYLDEDTTEYKELSSDQKILLIHCCVLNKEVYGAFGSQELLEKTNSEIFKIISDFLEKEFDAKNVLDKYIKEQLA